MQLRTSFFNPTVYRKNLTRFAPVWMLYTLCLVLGLVLMYYNGGTSKNYWFASHMAEMIPVMGVINLFYGLLTAQLLFGDLFNSRMCNALHAMPLRREGWFFTNVASGLTFSLVPTAVMAALSLPLLAGSLFEGAWKIAFLFFAAVNLQYICFFGIAVFAAMVTGNRFSMAAGYGLVNFGAVIVYWLVDTIYTPMLYGVITPTALMENLTPVQHMTNHTFLMMDNRSMLFEEFGKDLVGAVAHFHLTEEWWRLFACAGAGIGFALVALILYKKRDMECAGDAVAFKFLIPCFQIPCSIVVAAGAQFFLETFLGVYGYNFLVLGLGLIVGWFIGKMLTERTTRVFRLKNCYGLVALFAVIGLSLLATYFDVLNIEQYRPKPEDIQSIRFGTSYTSDKDLTEEADFEAILRLHQLAVEGQLEEPGAYVTENGQPVRFSQSAAYQAMQEEIITQEKAGVTNVAIPGVEGYYATQVHIVYTLENGKVINRRYNIWSDGEGGDIARSIMSRWEFVRQRYWGGNELDRLALALSTLKSINYDESLSPAHVETHQTLEDAQSLLEAIQADCAAGRMAQDSWLHTGNFRYEDTETDRGIYYRSSIYIYIRGEDYGWNVEVYPDSVNTVRWLQSRGLMKAELCPEPTIYW